MKTLITTLALLVVFSVSVASAQEVTLANAALPSPVLFGDATDCLVAAAKILPPKNAAKYCLEARKLEAHRAEQAVKSAAKAAQPVNYCGGWNPPAGCMYRSYGGNVYTTGSYITTGGGGYGFYSSRRPGPIARYDMPSSGTRSRPPGANTTGTAVRRK